MIVSSCSIDNDDLEEPHYAETMWEEKCSVICNPTMTAPSHIIKVSRRLVGVSVYRAE